MKHQAAYSLLFLSGAKPTQADVEKFMAAAGVKVDKEALTIFFKTLGDQSVVDTIAAGKKKLISMPSGGARAAGPAGAATAAAVVEEKVEEKEDVDMGGLFGGDDDEY